MHDIKPIGVIHSPHINIKDMPIQPKGAKDIKGSVILDKEYAEGLQDVDGISHIYLIYSFHKTTRTQLTVTPFMDTQKRGVFATRSPLRPNHIGLSIVRLERIEENELFVIDIDVLDGTPLLGIKPYIENFDSVEKSCSGWMTSDAETVAKTRSDARFK